MLGAHSTYIKGKRGGNAVSCAVVRSQMSDMSPRTTVRHLTCLYHTPTFKRGNTVNE